MIDMKRIFSPKGNGILISYEWMKKLMLLVFVKSSFPSYLQ
ncbi:unnamed protein product [Larinioides sclopetarius]|uniref:Uncharacterized protein n=1 Tax=Larinioides sclopetarius TaxID=280406 RepID=A0AAV1ZNY5_9ARAC